MHQFFLHVFATVSPPMPFKCPCGRGLKFRTPEEEPQLKGVETQLFSRQGFYLSVDRDSGSVLGIPEDGDSTVFYLIPVGLRIVSIQHRDTLLYIGMNSEGRLFTTDTYTSECKFKESVFDNFVVYTSCLYKQLESGRAWNIGISKDGVPVKGSHAKKNKPCTHFVPKPIEVHMFKEPSLCDIAAVSRADAKKRK